MLVHERHAVEIPGFVIGQGHRGRPHLHQDEEQCPSGQHTRRRKSHVGDSDARFPFSNTVVRQEDSPRLDRGLPNDTQDSQPRPERRHDSDLAGAFSTTKHPDDRTPEEETIALEALREVQTTDFVALLRAMSGLPVTVRLLDPPLHEFLPHVGELESKQALGELSAQEQKLLDAAHAWSEVNPMLGTRGVRLGVLKPGLYAMQVKALLTAADIVANEGFQPIIEIMIPLVTTKEELTLARSWVEGAIVQHARLPRTTAGNKAGKVRKISRPKVTIGTMIETPRAALVANELAEVSDFFSFGTNDLTQMTFGFSRDDVESRLMPQYLAAGLLKRNPFESIDAVGVGELVRMAAKRGRKTKRSLKLGVCGEHGGDPDSIAMFYAAGLDYVSCSPYRIPIARLACAQAIIGGSSTDSK